MPEEKILELLNSLSDEQVSISLIMVETLGALTDDQFEAVKCREESDGAWFAKAARDVYEEFADSADKSLHEILLDRVLGVTEKSA